MSDPRIQFGAATKDDVPAIVALLADDSFGAARETADLVPYLKAFDLMEANATQMLVVGRIDGRAVASVGTSAFGPSRRPADAAAASCSSPHTAVALTLIGFTTGWDSRPAIQV
jgi:hypothetical protein